MFVRNHMSIDPVTVSPDTPLPTIASLMAEREVRQVPVIDEERRLLGLITDRQVDGAGHNGRATGRTARDVMTVNPVATFSDAPLGKALRLICENKVRALPVLDPAGRVVGIITRRDFLEVMYRLLALDREGCCIELGLQDYKDDVATAMNVLREQDTELLSAVASCVRDDGDEPALYLRVSRHNSRRVEAALSRAGLILLEPESEDHSEREMRKAIAGNGSTVRS